MRFTEKEIELAKQLRDAGLEWKPEPGDWFYIKEDECGIIDEYFTVADSSETDILSWYNQAMHEFDRQYCVWLPLWHQCKKIIEKRGYYLLLLIKGNNVQIDLWYLETNRYVGVFRGETDLEVIYQALLNLYL